MKHCSMKPDSIKKRLNQIEKNIERFCHLEEYERIFMVDYIQWLFQFGHISKETKTKLIDKIYEEYRKAGLL